MKRIFKYPIDTIKLPKGSKILHGSIQVNKFFIWAEVEDTELKKVNFYGSVIGTGQHILEEYDYINTISKGGYVWHFYYKMDN